MFNLFSAFNLIKYFHITKSRVRLIVLETIKFNFHVSLSLFRNSDHTQCRFLQKYLTGKSCQIHVFVVVNLTLKCQCFCSIVKNFQVCLNQIKSCFDSRAVDLLLSKKGVLFVISLFVSVFVSYILLLFTIRYYFGLV